MCPHLDHVLSRSVFCSTFPFMWLKGTFRTCHPHVSVSHNSVQRRCISDSNSLELQLVLSFQAQNASHSWSYLGDQREDKQKYFLFLKINFFLLPYLYFSLYFTAASPAEFPAFKAHRIQLDESKLAKGKCRPLLFFGFLRGP